MITRYINHKEYSNILYWYAFFSTGPRIILLIAFPFFIFAFLLLRFPVFIKRIFLFNKPETILVLLLIISGITSGYLSENVGRSFRPTFNFVYWQILILFFFNNRNHLPWNSIIKAITFGIIYTIFQQFFIKPFVPKIPFIGMPGKNSFAFFMLSFTPLALLYIKNLYGYRAFYFFAGLFLIAAAINGSRAGFGILTVQTAYLFYVNNFKRVNLLFPSAIALAIFIFFQYRTPIGNLLSRINPEYGELVLEDDILDRDVSFLIRKAQIIKGRALISENPYFGIGLLNFSKTPFKFKADFVGANYVIYKDYVDKVETHNSYLTLATELGMIAFILFLILILLTLLKYIFRLSENDFAVHAFFISLLGMLTHFYFANVIINSFVWFTIGLIIALINRSKKLPPILSRYHVRI